MKKDSKPIIILVVGIVCILLAPWLLTRDWGPVSFKGTGTIGDTIGGITAPITGLVGAFLVYYALRAQIDANEIIRKQFAIQQTEEKYQKVNSYITYQVNFLREDLKDFSILVTDTVTQGRRVVSSHTITYNGVEAISEALQTFSQDFGHNWDSESEITPHVYQVLQFLNRIQHIVITIDAANLSPNDANFLKSIVASTYTAKLYPFLREHESNRVSRQPKCEICQRKHTGIPEYIYEHYDFLNSQLLNVPNQLPLTSSHSNSS